MVALLVTAWGSGELGLMGGTVERPWSWILCWTLSCNLGLILTSVCPNAVTHAVRLTMEPLT